MKKKIFINGLAALLFTNTLISAHCQMPCGIYHDDMVYDQIDQYVETMYKGMTVMSDDKFANLHDKNEFVRWVIEKENASNDIADLILKYFLQQKIKPGEPDTAKQLESAHRLLFLSVSIKQNADRKQVEDFADEWDKFKVMFHVEGYACKVEQLKERKRQKLLDSEAKKEAVDDHDHDHDHEHDHDHDHQ